MQSITQHLIKRMWKSCYFFTEKISVRHNDALTRKFGWKKIRVLRKEPKCLTAYSRISAGFFKIFLLKAARQAILELSLNSGTYLSNTVAMNELLYLKNAGAQISLFFTSYE